MTTNNLQQQIQKAQEQYETAERGLLTTSLNVENTLDELVQARMTRRKARTAAREATRAYQVSLDSEEAKQQLAECAKQAHIAREVAHNAEARYELARTHYTQAYDIREDAQFRLLCLERQQARQEELEKNGKYVYGEFVPRASKRKSFKDRVLSWLWGA